MRSNSSKRLFEYWNRLRANRPAPERSEIEPSDIRELLGDTFILEIDTVMKSISYRLAGTRLCSIYGRELKGYAYLGVWDEIHNLSVIQSINRTYTDYQPVLISHAGSTIHGRSTHFETLLLPLLPTNSGSSRVLGICTATDKNAFWLGTEHIVTNSVTKVRDLTLEDDSQGPSIAPSMANMAIKSGNEDLPSIRRKHLRVIEGGRND